MFTGIVEETGVVQRAEKRSGEVRLDIAASTVLRETRQGDSILVNGVCLTVERMTEMSFTAFLSRESLDRTTLGGLESQDQVNLERALAMGDRLGGHLVSGHVEGIGRIVELKRDGEGYTLIVSCPPEFGLYIVEKGSVSVDGVSLTIAKDLGQSFAVSMIPETFEKTTFRLKTPGNFVNLEPDLLLKYVMSAVRNLAAGGTGGSITLEKLRDAGFIAD